MERIVFYIYFLSSTYEYAHINGGIYYVSNNPMPEVPGGAWHPCNRVLQESGIIYTIVLQMAQRRAEPV